jgi:hypothetical protein
MDEDLFVKFTNDIGGPGALAEEDKDFLKSLEKIAAEIEREADNLK